MKVLISVDMEGLPDVFYTGPGEGMAAAGFAEARKTMTALSAALAEGYRSNGVGEIDLEDAHGSMTNLIYSELPDYVRLIKGGIKPLDMIYGIGNGYDGLAFLGFHSAAGTAHSSFDHTYDGDSFHRIMVNGKPASEYYLCSLVAGEHDVPVLLVAGDDKLALEVHEKTPWAEYVTLKESYGYWSAGFPSLASVTQSLRNAAGISLSAARMKGRRENLLKLKEPIDFAFEMKRSVYADTGELLPGIKRLDGYTLGYTASSVTEGYRVMQLLSYAAIGTEKSISE